jgi:endonuclease III related protein
MTPTLHDVFQKLYDSLGPQDWWPGDTSFEVCVGAILTQNTNWGNVEKAIHNLKKRDVLAPHKLYNLSHEELASLIKPAGYFNIKAKRLRAFLEYLVIHYDGDLDKMLEKSLTSLREELLGVKGIGPETADSILLYAGNKPIFVVDTYTRRIFVRHGWIGEDFDYMAIQDHCMSALPEDVPLFNEFHALIVMIGKNYCKPKPRCDNCPLKCYLPNGVIVESF